MFVEEGASWESRESWNENLHECEVRRFRPLSIFGRHALPAMPVGLAENTPCQRNLFVSQARAGTARRELRRRRPCFARFTCRYLRSTNPHGRV